MSQEAQVSDDTLAAVKKQIEFYFSDYNLPQDKFLRGKVAEDPMGFVDIKILLTFKRLKKLTTKVEDVEKALEGSELCETKDGKIRRKIPLPEVTDRDRRSVHIEGFARSLKQEDIERFFFTIILPGEIGAARMVKGFGGKFFGAVWVECKSIEAAEKLLKMDLKYGEDVLVARTKKDATEEFARRREARLKKRKREEEKGQKKDEEPAVKKVKLSETEVKEIKEGEEKKDEVEEKKDEVEEKKDE